MKNKYLSIFLIFFLIYSFSICAKETIYEIKADKIKLKNNQNTILAEGNANAWTQDGRKIFSDIIIYDKKKNYIQAIGNSKYVDNSNLLTAKKFEYNVKNETIVAYDKVKLVDKQKNKFHFSKLIYNFNSKKGEGSLLQGYTNDGSFIKSKKVIIDQNQDILKFYNANFTTCSNVYDKNNNFCPSWSLNDKEIIHDKKKKLVIHKHAVLKIKEIPILYTPYISHPDPTVKRQTGFLAPSLQSIDKLGRGIKTPYFWAIAEDRDLTLEPVFYFNERSLFLTTYKQAFKNSNLVINSGFSDGYKNLDEEGRTSGSRNYFFSNFESNFDGKFFGQNKFNIKIERLSQKNFLKVHKINTDLFKEDINILNNLIKVETYGSNKSLSIDASIIEDINAENYQKYTYVLPRGTFSYNNSINDLSFNLSSNFLGQKFSNNQKQGKIENAFNLNTKNYINNNLGTGTVFKFGLQNNNIYNDNVVGEKNNWNIDSFSTIGIDNTMPFGKFTKNTNQIITPRIFAKYTTGNMNNIKSESKILEYADVFSMNRSNLLSKPETGVSYGHGLDYNILLKKNDKKFLKTDFGIGQVFRTYREDNMPTSSSLNNKSSDFAGIANLKIFGDEIKFIEDKKNLSIHQHFKSNYLNLDYKFNLDNDFSKIKRNNISLSQSYNKNYTKVEFNELNSEIGNSRDAEVIVRKLFNENYYLEYAGKKNLKTENSEYQNFGIVFENDCIQTMISLNKTFYSNQDLRPNKSLIFSITIKPFSDSISPNLSGLLN